MHPNLEQLEQRQLIWRGRESSAPLAARPTGWTELDRQLGGLPGSGVVTVQSPVGIGELRLLWPFFAGDARLVVFIAPPYPLNAESLEGADLDLERLLVLQPSTEREALWAAEQCLKSGACQSVCLWQKRVRLAQARRLQLAARTGQSTQFLFLGARHSAAGLPVDLCLVLTPHPQGIAVTVPRRRQGWALPRFVVSMTDAWPELTRQSRPGNRLSFPSARSDVGAGAG